ncbi:MAG: GCN5-related N-acetyltransferase [Firmicutes bacterium]|nr:GCN5-related N-acetyltransferase [Bacillota bacterium]
MNIETNRLLLKSISVEDRDFIFSQFSDDIVTKYLFDEEPLTSISGADEIIASYANSNSISLCRWIMIRKSDQEKMGTCGFHCWYPSENIIDIGYDLKEEFWGKGYMQEALKEIINIAVQELKIKQINAHIYYENDKSIKLVERLGFHFNGQKYNCTFRGIEYLHKVFSLDCTGMK